jgi:hypothetical protein
MQEIRTSGSMSGDGKRSVAAWPKLPRPSSTLPSRRMAATLKLGKAIGGARHKPRIRRAYQSDVNDPKETLDVQCNRLPRLQNDQHTPVVKSVILRSHPVWR